MRKSKLLLAAAAVLVSSTAGLAAYAQVDDEGRGAPAMPPPAMMPPVGGPDVVFTIAAPPLLGGIEEEDILEASMVPPAELFLASLPPTAGGPTLVADAGHGGHHGLFPKEQALTDDQWEKLYQVSKEFNDKSAPKMFELQQASSSLKDALMAVDVDRSKATSLQNKINGLHGDLASLKLDKKLAMLAVLTPDQRKVLHERFLKMAVMHDFMRGHRGMMMRRMHGGGGGACPMGMGGGGKMHHGGHHGHGGPGGPGAPGGPDGGPGPGPGPGPQ